MRLHRLEVERFGPFAERVCIDIDALAGQGLFLLHGPTGAGKTSLLDAICFALYGAVPGPRAKTERLTSDHVDQATPEVVCEFTAAGRRFEVTRSPAWDRPKSRGRGTTKQQAKVVVRERISGHWVVRADRLDEAGLLLGDVLGMGKEQFTKVVLLPQGDFAAFLRAGADERRTLLEKLFGTSRFTAVESWLAEQRSGTRVELEAATGQRNDLLARADERARALTDYEPDALAAITALPAERADDAACQLVQRWRQLASTSVAAAIRARHDTAAHALAARNRAETVQHELNTLGQLHALLAERQALLDASRTHEADREQTARAERAEHLRLRLDQADEADEAAAQALTRELTARKAVAGVSTLLTPGPALPGTQTRQGTQSQLTGQSPHDPFGQLAFDFDDLALTASSAEPAQSATHDGGPTDEQLPAEIEARKRLVGVLESLADDEASLVAGEQALAELQADVNRLGSLGDEHRSQQAEAESAQAGIEADLRRLAPLIASIPVLVERRDLATARAKAAQQAHDLAVAVATAVDAHQRAADASLRARTHHLDLVQRRLDGMAAELSRELVDGTDCPVCGATEHPRPADPARVHVDADDLDRAAQLSREADHRAGEAALERSALEARLAAARAASDGLSLSAAADARADTHAAVDAAEQARARAGGLNAELERLRHTVATARHAAEAAQAQLQQRTAQLSRQQVLADEVRARVESARAGFDTLAARRARLEADIEALTALVAAVQARTEATDRAERAHILADRDCAAAGFDTRSAARQALLDPATRTALQAQLKAHDDEVTAVLSRLASQELRQLASALSLVDGDARWPSADDLVEQHLQRVGLHLDAVRALVRQCSEDAAHADATATAAAARATELEPVATALASLAKQVSTLTAATAPLRERYAVLDELAGTASGLSSSNSRRMRLSAFVLQARLEQVALAASQRLQLMSQGRYTLHHSEVRERGGQRSGLGLRVMDAWTSQQRDTASLSGGESFLASLALALGLADVVQAESGGISIETLFIDEGFGTLDDETLELVMECLDQLREGGRAVGVVSHVGELRTRIPTQLHVTKTRSGSSVRHVEGLAS